VSAKAGSVATPLRSGLLFGRSSDCGAVLDDPSVSRRHFGVVNEGGAWFVEDLGSRSGTYLNGHLFKREPLVIGDTVAAGPFAFRFDGLALTPVGGVAGAALSADALTVTRGGRKLLDRVTFSVEPGCFTGIIGPSGAGKSTLLDALCGLRPADSGSVTVDGSDLALSGEALRQELGYVPQDDIVPTELTPRAALEFSARLRLPATAPRDQIRRLVESTCARVGLGSRMDVRVGRLSGGQRKRVSVAAELLARPRLLFLDEPTSGLDPATEFRLMRTLREVSGLACTVFCTTHVVENAHLFDRLAVMCGGQLVYFGPPDEAPAHFGAESLAGVYEKLDALDPTRGRSVPRRSRTRIVVRHRPKPRERAAALPVLFERQMAILRSDPKNLLLLMGQPVAIGALVVWVSRDPALVLFFAYVATLWFGCGNAAQEIVRELPMFRRERLIGLSGTAYLAAKFLALSTLTLAQVAALYAVMQIGCLGIGGNPLWQAAGLTGAALASVAVGLAISAWARSVLQAVMLVPLVLIPQILFAGFVPPAGDFGWGPRMVSRVMPSAAAQSVMDVSLFWGKKVTGTLRVDFPSTFSNLNRSEKLRNGQIFRNAKPAVFGLAVLLGWVVAALAVASRFLAAKERGSL